MTIFDEKVAEYKPQNAIQRLNAQHQVMQQIILVGLQTDDETIFVNGALSDAS